MAQTAPLEMMTPEQVAEYLQLRKETVYRYIREQKLPAIRLGRTYRISRLDLELFLFERRTRSDVRRALFERVRAMGERNADIPPEQVERDVAEAVAEVRRSLRD
jgi:excisionase family DNA binding protein